MKGKYEERDKPEDKLPSDGPRWKQFTMAVPLVERRITRWQGLLIFLGLRKELGNRKYVSFGITLQGDLLVGSHSLRLLSEEQWEAERSRVAADGFVLESKPTRSGAVAKAAKFAH